MLLPTATSATFNFFIPIGFRILQPAPPSEITCFFFGVLFSKMDRLRQAHVSPSCLNIFLYVSTCFYDTHPVKQTSSQDEFHQKSPESDELIERNHGKERHPRHLKLHKPSQTVSHKLPVQLPVTNFTIHTACKATANYCYL